MNGGPRIALDAMGGDSGPAGMIAGAARALRRDPSLHFIVYGDQAEVEAELDNHRPLLGAVTYRRFLDNIEPSERPYHDGDPARALRRAIEITEVAVTLA